MGLTAKQKRNKQVREARRILRVADAAGHFEGMRVNDAVKEALDILDGRYPVYVSAEPTGMGKQFWQFKVVEVTEEKNGKG